MEKDRIVLKDGTEIEGGSASRTNQQLLVKVPGSDIVKATLLFADPEKTETIICYSGVYKKTYTGFTQMFSIQYFQDQDEVQVWLKGEENRVSEESEYTVPEEYLPESMRTKKEEQADE